MEWYWWAPFAIAASVCSNSCSAQQAQPPRTNELTPSSSDLAPEQSDCDQELAKVVMHLRDSDS